MTTLITVALPDILSFIVDNRGRSCPTASTGVPLIATNCLKAGSRSPVFENVRYVDDDTLQTWFRAHPEPGDVLFVCKGSPGRVAVVPDPVPFCIAQDMVALRADRKIVDPLYLYYRLSSRDVQASIGNMHVGTMIPHFKKGDFHKLQFSIHASTSDQRAIAEVLGALDDKIAANSKTVAALLNLADAHFDLAVREAIQGETTFGGFAAIGGGGTPRTSVDEYWSGHVSWATPTDITALSAPYLSGTSRTITPEGLAACASSLYPKGSILMTSRATIGAFAIAQVQTAVNQGFIVVNAHEAEHQWWLFHEMKSRVPEFLSFANGATFLELPRGKFKEIPMRTVSANAMSTFGALVSPLHSAAVALTSESVKLAATRDELLPLLMSGKVRIKDAEKSIEEVL